MSPYYQVQENSLKCKLAIRPGESSQGTGHGKLWHALSLAWWETSNGDSTLEEKNERKWKSAVKRSNDWRNRMLVWETAFYWNTTGAGYHILSTYHICKGILVINLYRLLQVLSFLGWIISLTVIMLIKTNRIIIYSIYSKIK